MHVYMTWVVVCICSIIGGYLAATRFNGVVNSALAFFFACAVTAVVGLLTSKFFFTPPLADSGKSLSYGGADMAVVAYIMIFLGSMIIAMLPFIFMKNRKSNKQSRAETKDS